MIRFLLKGCQAICCLNQAINTDTYYSGASFADNIYKRKDMTNRISTRLSKSTNRQLMTQEKLED